MHHKFPGETPRTPTCGKGWPLPHTYTPPFGDSHLNEALEPGAPAIFNHAPEEKKLDTPGFVHYKNYFINKHKWHINRSLTV